MRNKILAGAILYLMLFYMIWRYYLNVGSDKPAYMGHPHEYADDVDFRIIVLTYNRPESLRKCLSHIAEIETLGDRVAVDIWIDRSRDGTFDQFTWTVADDFRRTWQQGVVDVHVQPNHSYIIGQWVNTWRPRQDSKELALLLEDDIDVSPLAYKWLKATAAYFGDWPEVAGYTLQMENVKFITAGKYRLVDAPATDPVFLYQLFATWGYAPKANYWREFQDWFHRVWKDPDFHPYLPGTELDDIYRRYERWGRRYGMWEMYVVHYNYVHSLYTVYPNLVAYTGKSDVLLDTNRQESGLHSGGGYESSENKLLRSWDPRLVHFNDRVARYVFDKVEQN